MNRFSSIYLSKTLKVLFLSFFILGTVASCNPFSFLNQTDQTTTELPEAEVVFQVLLPAALPQNTKLAIELLDDVTGLAFNPTRYEMTQQDDRSYYVKLPLAIGSVVKYRYVRQSDVSTVEYTPQNTQVRFRLANITGSVIIQDNVAGWVDQPYTGVIGRVRGQFIDKGSNAPIPNLLVTAQGVQTVTASDGTFILEGLAPGTQNLVAYSMDGQFKTFSQGVTIAEESTTPVFVYLDKRELVSVTFDVSTPNTFDARIPLRFASNLQSLGNAYADLYSGSTTVSANLPVVTRVSAGHYQVQLKLPVGFDLHYKYTLGDGLWNSELTSKGNFVLRELIIPAQNTTVNDRVATFNSTDYGAVSFSVTSPKDTPSDEIVSLQLNPFGWFESIPMVQTGKNQWAYTLYSPLALFGQIEYRFCRNDMCEQTQAIASSQQIFAPAQQPQSISITIGQWANYSVSSTPTVIVTDGGGLSPRTDFIAGFEMSLNYSPVWPAYINNGLKKAAVVGSNVVVLSPTWTATRNTPPYLEPVPGSDISWSEMQTTILQAKQNNLDVVLFPRVNFPNGAAAYWSTAKRDDGWWTSWFDRYHRYMMQVADWAALTGIKAIVIGDPMLGPSMSNGKLADGTSSNAPDTADAQWRQLAQDLHAHFSGTILGAVTYPNSTSNVPGWLDSVDGIYLLYSPALSQTNNVTVSDLQNTIIQDLGQNVTQEISGLNKPVWLSLNYPSSANALAGCTDTLGSCLDDWGNDQIDLETQTHIYNAAVIAAAKKTWIKGFISRGNQPLAAIMDGSSSVLSKPSSDVLWFWYHFILNKSA